MHKLDMKKPVKLYATTRMIDYDDVGGDGDGGGGSDNN